MRGRMDARYSWETSRSPNNARSTAAPRPEVAGARYSHLLLVVRQCVLGARGFHCAKYLPPHAYLASPWFCSTIHMVASLSYFQAGSSAHGCLSSLSLYRWQTSSVCQPQRLRFCCSESSSVILVTSTTTAWFSVSIPMWARLLHAHLSFPVFSSDVASWLRTLLCAREPPDGFDFRNL